MRAIALCGMISTRQKAPPTLNLLHLLKDTKRDVIAAKIGGGGSTYAVVDERMKLRIK